MNNSTLLRLYLAILTLATASIVACVAPTMPPAGSLGRATPMLEHPTVTPTAAAQPPSPTMTTATPYVAPPHTVTPTTSPSPTPTALPVVEISSPTATPTPTPSAVPAPMPVATPTPAQAPSFPPAPLIVRGNPSTGYVALTFDAGGRDEGLTLSVLDTLKNEGIPATFFLTGEWSRHNQSLVQRMIEDGHELANHTDSHPDLTTLDEASIVAEIVKTEQTIEAITGMPIARMMRPPFGAYNQSVLSAMGKLEYEVIYWTLDSGDWRPERTVEDIVTTVTSQVQPGDIVVMHCYPAKTAKALPHIVEGLHARGLKMGTVTQTRGLGD